MSFVRLPGSKLIVFIIALNIFYPKILFAEKQIIGVVEKVAIDASDFSVQARIDTGAKNSSLNAEYYALHNKGGGQWVRFRVTNREGQSIDLEKRVLRIASIKRKGAKAQKRPVIMLDVCIGNILKQVEVNLVNRKKFTYQMLIGRSYLKGDFLVDAEQKFSVQPVCRH